MLKNILDYLKKSKSGKLDDKKAKKSMCPTIVVEESFTMEGTKCDGTFKISFEVPISMLDIHSDKEEIENIKQCADATFRPIVSVLIHYLLGMCRDNSPERFLIGRNNLVAAIKQCAALQIRSIQESENNR